MKRFAEILVVVCCAGSASAEVFTVPIDPLQSSVTATLRLFGASSADSSPVSGSVRLRLDTVGAPMTISGLDFDLALTEPLDHSIGSGGNQFVSTVSDFHLVYAMPGTTIGPVPASPTFVFADVPADARGMLSYTATGTVCIVLLANGVPCDDLDDLSSEPTSSVDFAGTVSATALRIVSVEASVDQIMPVDAMNPSLGTLHVQGTIRGSVFVPVIPGDANGDCAVNFADVTSVLQHFGEAGIPGDADSDGAVDFGDITSILQNWGAACG